MKQSASAVAILLAVAASGQRVTSKAPPSTKGTDRVIMYCAYDGVITYVPDKADGLPLARLWDVDSKIDADSPATFDFVRGRETILSFTLSDLSAPDLWITTDSKNGQLALTYSDGGAIGGFHVRVFRLKGKSIVDDTHSIDRAVSDFKARHFCRTRGNNVQALQWVEGDLLLMTEVYPTGDCGPDLGHVEGYRIDVQSGRIKEHLTEKQLKNYPGVCFVNESR